MFDISNIYSNIKLHFYILHKLVIYYTVFCAVIKQLLLATVLLNRMRTVLNEILGPEKEIRMLINGK